MSIILRTLDQPHASRHGSMRRSPRAGGDNESLRARAPADHWDMLEVSELAACLNRLRPEQREVPLLVSLESLGYTQMGNIPGTREGGVHAFYWIDREVGYALSGDVQKEEMLKIARTIYEHFSL